MYTFAPKDSETILPLAARTADATTDAQDAHFAKGAIFTLYCSARSGTSPTLDVKIQGKDEVSGNWYDLDGAAFAQLTAATSAPVYLTVYPGVAETANQTVSDVLPRAFRVVADVGGTSPSFTYSVGVTLIP